MKNIIESTIASPIVRATTQEQGTCPVCNGTLVMRFEVFADAYYKRKPSYDPITSTIEGCCNNCGGQYQFGKPTGKTYLRIDGTPCKHEHRSRNIGRCYNQYDCIHCVDSFTIDSSD